MVDQASTGRIAAALSVSHHDETLKAAVRAIIVIDPASNAETGASQRAVITQGSEAASAVVPDPTHAIEGQGLLAGTAAATEAAVTIGMRKGDQVTANDTFSL